MSDSSFGDAFSERGKRAQQALGAVGENALYQLSKGLIKATDPGYCNTALSSCISYEDTRTASEGLTTKDTSRLTIIDTIMQGETWIARCYLDKTEITYTFENNQIRAAIKGEEIILPYDGKKGFERAIAEVQSMAKLASGISRFDSLDDGTYSLGHRRGSMTAQSPLDGYCTMLNEIKEDPSNNFNFIGYNNPGIPTPAEELTEPCSGLPVSHRDKPACTPER